MRHMVVCGDSVEIEAPFDVSMPCTTFARWTVDGQSFEFGSGRADFAEVFARSMGVMDFEAEYSFEEGSLKIGTDKVYDSELSLVAPRKWGVWRGTSFSFLTQKVEASTERLIDVISAFRVREDQIGVQLVPRNSAATPLRTPGRPCVFKGLQGIGLATLRARTTEGDRALPKWSGQKVRGGELFGGANSLLDDGRVQKSLVLVADSATAELDIELDADEEAAVDAMSKMVLTWTLP